MDATFKAIVGQQYGAAIDMLDDALVACPDELWSDPSQKSQFWYVAYHGLFWLDLYLTGAVEGFAPPPPFTLSELNPAGELPERVYSKAELRGYLQHCRQKCRVTLDELSDEQAAKPYRFPSGLEISFLELQLYNMRHVQEHAAQLSWILGQQLGWEARWVSRARSLSHAIA
jgi:hypothetical protein